MQFFCILLLLLMFVTILLLLLNIFVSVHAFGALFCIKERHSSMTEHALLHAVNKHKDILEQMLNFLT